MRAIPTLAAVALCVALACQTQANAADTPTAAQIIESLAPAGDGAMVTRGIRLGGQPLAITKSITKASTGPVNRGEASLSVPFAFGSAAISPAATRVLDQLGEALTSPKLAEFKFRVEGHTDTAGLPDVNQTLSERRAASVDDYLVTKYGIDRARLTQVGMGQDGLLVETGPGVANAANRRVLVVNLGH